MLMNSTFLSESVARIVLIEQKTTNSHINSSTNGTSHYDYYEMNIVNTSLKTSHDFLHTVQILSPFAKAEYLNFLVGLQNHKCAMDRYNKLFDWFNQHCIEFSNELLLYVSPTSVEWNELILLAILKLTASIERILRHICYCEDVKCPMLMKDILQMPLFHDLFGEFSMKILQIIIGGPLGLNIRNLSWHGFLSPSEVPKNFFFLLMWTCNEMAVKYLSPSVEIFKPHPHLNSQHANALKYFQDMKLTFCKSDFMEIISNSKFVSAIMLPHFKFAMKLYRDEMYGDCLIMLLPLFEHVLRCLFAHCNNCSHRVLTAESSEFYLTLDKVLLKNVAGGDNKLTQYLGKDFMEFLIDFFELQNGLRIRDRISHGERNTKMYPSITVDIIVFAIMVVAHPKNIYDTTDVDKSKIQKTFTNYFSFFHPFVVVQSLCKEWNKNMQALKDCDILNQHEYRNIHENIELIKNTQLSFSKDQAKIFLTSRLRTLYQGTKDTLALSTILKQISQSCLVTVQNLLHFLTIRNQQIIEKKLRSRQRTNFTKFLEIVPNCYVINQYLLGLIAKLMVVEFNNPHFLFDKEREWKKLLKICENLVTLTSMSKNKWEEAAALIKHGMHILRSL